MQRPMDSSGVDTSSPAFSFACLNISIKMTATFSGPSSQPFVPGPSTRDKILPSASSTIAIVFVPPPSTPPKKEVILLGNACGLQCSDHH
jgi:hypothetical protein